MRRGPPSGVPVRSSSTASSGDTGLTGSPVPSSRPAISRPGVDLPVPMVGGVDLLMQRRRMEHEVVGRAVEASASLPSTWRSASAAAAMSRSVARAKSASWRRGTTHTSNGERLAQGANATAWPSAYSSRSGGAPRRGPGGSTGTPPRGSGTARRRRAPRRSGVGSAEGRTGRSTGGSSGRRPARPSSGRPGGRRVRSGARLAAISSRERRSSPSIVSLPTAWSGRCSPGGATTVRHDPAARASAIVTCAMAPSRCRASSSVPATVKAKSLRTRSRMPSPDGMRQLKQSPRSSIGADGRANRSRANVRSTTVATHQPVIASLRSSNRPWLARGPRLTPPPAPRSASSARRSAAGSASRGAVPRSAAPRCRANAGAKAAAAPATRPSMAARRGGRARRRSTSRRGPASRTGR